MTKPIQGRKEAGKRRPLAAASVEQVRPPDGGYGWVVLAGSFFCSVILDGVAYTFGLFFVEFLAHFNEHKSKTAWVGSVFNGMYMFIGEWLSTVSHASITCYLAYVGPVTGNSRTVISL